MHATHGSSVGVGCAFVWASVRCCIVQKNSAMQLLFRVSVAAACSPAVEQLTAHWLLLANLGGCVMFLGLCVVAMLLLCLPGAVCWHCSSPLPYTAVAQSLIATVHCRRCTRGCCCIVQQ